MKKPTQQDFDTAIMWLESNNGRDGEQEACLAVAGWIEQNQKRAFEKSEARRAGCSVKYLRKIMSERA